jgi:L-malate glycosyltransferase
VLVPSNDPEAWSALLDVLKCPNRARQLGAAARRWIETEFALPIVVDRYLELYQRLLDGTWPARIP